MEIDYTFLHNTKVTGSAIQESKRLEKRRDKNHPTGRAISMMEVISILLGYDQVYTNIKFVHIPTVQLAERPALDKTKPICTLEDQDVVPFGTALLAKQPKDLDSGKVIPAFTIRNEKLLPHLPIWRRLSTSESLICCDILLCPFTLDAITIFGIRPPELRFVRDPAKYF